MTMFRKTLLGVACLSLAACATGTPQDPRVDNGLFSTVSGLSGDYENYTLNQLRALDAEDEAQRDLERRGMNLSSQERIALSELAALEAELATVRGEVSALERRVAAARASGAANAEDVMRLERQLAAVRAEDRRVAMAMNDEGADLEALRARRDALVSEAEDLEALVETLGF